MSDAEEIRRLAELRDQGLITTAEFSDRKRKILKGKRAWWKTALLWIIGLWCLVALLSILAAIFGPIIRNLSAGGDLACDMPEVKEKVIVLLNQESASTLGRLGFGGIASAMQIHGIGEVQQLYKDEQSGFVACVGKTQHAKGEGLGAYTISWANRESGQFMVNIANPEALVARYGQGDE